MEAYNPLYSDQNDKQVIVAAKIIVYAGSPDKYYSFLTPESYTALKEWMDYRALHGEKITGESWVMRDLWRTTNIRRGANRSLATNPRQLKASAIKKLLQRALWGQNLRPSLQEGQRRHEWKSAHGFRKFFKTKAERAMRPIHIELIMGHSSGISDSYYRPTEAEMLADYIRAIDHLTINTKQVRESDAAAAAANEAASLKKELETLKSNMNQLIENQVSMALFDERIKTHIASELERAILKHVTVPGTKDSGGGGRSADAATIATNTDDGNSFS